MADITAFAIKKGEGNGNPLKYSCLENPVDGGTWWAAVHRVAQSRTWLKQLSMHACMHWRRKWQHPSVFLPGESQGPRSLVGCCLWGHTELDTGHDWSDLAAAAIKKVSLNFPGGPVVKNPPANAGDMSSILGPGRSHKPGWGGN